MVKLNKTRNGVDQPTVMGARSATVVAICEDGAVLTYEDPDTGCYVSSTHLDEEDTDTQLLSYSRTPQEIILDIGGASFLGALLDKIAKIGTLYSQAISATFMVIDFVDAWTRSKIEDAGYGRIINAYDPVEKVSSSVIAAWDNYPYIDIGTRLIDVHLELLPAN